MTKPSSTASFQFMCPAQSRYVTRNTLSGQFEILILSIGSPVDMVVIKMQKDYRLTASMLLRPVYNYISDES